MMSSCLCSKSSRESLPLADGFKLLFPDGGRIRECDLRRQYLDGHPRFLGRQEFLLLECQEVALQEVLDDAGERGLCADAAALLEFCLEGRVLDVLVDFLHGLEKRGLSEALRRLGDFGEHAAVLHRDSIPLLCFGEIRRLFFLVAVASASLIELLPAGVDDTLAVGGEILACRTDFNPGAVIDMDRIELRDIGKGDHAVEVLLGLGQAGESAAYRCRDDGVMC